MSIDRGMDKEDVVHTYSGILLSHKEWNNATCNNMDEPRDYRTEWSQTNVWYRLYVKSKKKKKDTNEFLSKTETHRHRKQFYGYQRGKGARGGINQEAGINMYTPLYIK